MNRHAWLLTYPDGKTRIIWAEFREILSDGTIVFYDANPPNEQGVRRATTHTYAIAAGHWKDVRVDPTELAGDLETLGTPQREVSKRRH